MATAQRGRDPLASLEAFAGRARHSVDQGPRFRQQRPATPAPHVTCLVPPSPRRAATRLRAMERVGRRGRSLDWSWFPGQPGRVLRPLVLSCWVSHRSSSAPRGAHEKHRFRGLVPLLVLYFRRRHTNFLPKGLFLFCVHMNNACIYLCTSNACCLLRRPGLAEVRCKSSRNKLYSCMYLICVRGRLHVEVSGHFQESVLPPCGSGKTAHILGLGGKCF